MQKNINVISQQKIKVLSVFSQIRLLIEFE